MNDKKYLNIYPYLPLCQNKIIYLLYLSVPIDISATGCKNGTEIELVHSEYRFRHTVSLQ